MATQLFKPARRRFARPNFAQAAGVALLSSTILASSCHPALQRPHSSRAAARSISIDSLEARAHQAIVEAQQALDQGRQTVALFGQNQRRLDTLDLQMRHLRQADSVQADRPIR